MCVVYLLPDLGGNMEDKDEELWMLMYNKTFYYNRYSDKVFNGMHFENHKVALFHHLVDMKMLLMNRGIHIPKGNDQNMLPFIEAVLIDTLPVRFSVDDKMKMVEEHAKKNGIDPAKAKTIYVKIIDILSTRIGLSTLVFTGWLNTKNKTGYYMVVSEMI